MKLVGERGPELVDLPRGSRILPTAVGAASVRRQDMTYVTETKLLLSAIQMLASSIEELSAAEPDEDGALYWSVSAVLKIISMIPEGDRSDAEIDLLKAVSTYASDGSVVDRL